MPILVGMRRPQPLPPTLVGRSFAVTDEAAREVGRRRTRAGDLESPFRGVRQPAGAPRSLVVRCAAYTARMPDTQVFSHLSAAQLLGLPLPARLMDGDLHVTAIAPARAPRHPGMIGHTAASLGDIWFVGAARVTSAVETWMSLAIVLSLDDLIMVGDALVRRKNPLATMVEIDAALAGARGRRGHRLLRAARQEMRAGVDSPRETELRLLVTRAGLPEPVVNQRHYGAGGEYLGRGDLAYPEWKVLLEYDGSHHYLDEAQGHIDVERLARFADDDWGIVRINRSNVHIAGYVVARVTAALRKKGWPG